MCFKRGLELRDCSECRLVIGMRLCSAVQAGWSNVRWRACLINFSSAEWKENNAELKLVSWRWVELRSSNAGGCETSWGSEGTGLLAALKLTWKMTTLRDIGVAALVNIGVSILFLVSYVFLSLQPVNDRVYYPKLYIEGIRKGRPRASPRQLKPLEKYFNLEFYQYFNLVGWAKSALLKNENDLIQHAGLDSAVFLRIFLVGLVFIPFRRWYVFTAVLLVHSYYSSLCCFRRLVSYRACASLSHWLLALYHSWTYTYRGDMGGYESGLCRTD